MTNSIVQTQTAIPGIELIYLEDRDAAGIHISGLSRLLSCQPMTVQRVVETLTEDLVTETEILTEQGFRTVTFILEKGVVQVLKAIRRSSRIKKETRDNAEELYDRFAEAGFKLYAMLKVAPEVLKQKLENVQLETTPPQLPPADIRIVNLYGALTGFGIDITNPRFKQPLQDLVMDKILGEVAALPESKEVWLGVAEKAEQMGYQVSLVTRYRSQLGKYVASQGLTSQKEKRLCNGTQRPINVYLDCKELEVAIAEFLDAKILSVAS